MDAVARVSSSSFFNLALSEIRTSSYKCARLMYMLLSLRIAHFSKYNVRHVCVRQFTTLEIAIACGDLSLCSFSSEGGGEDIRFSQFVLSLQTSKHPRFLILERKYCLPFSSSKKKKRMTNSRTSGFDEAS